LLRRPLYEVLADMKDVVMPPIYNCMRLCMLIMLDLDDNDRVVILKEMCPNFRQNVFQRPVGSLLPFFLRLTFLDAQSEGLFLHEGGGPAEGGGAGDSEAPSMTKESEQLEELLVEEKDTHETHVVEKTNCSSTVSTSANTPDGSPSRKAKHGDSSETHRKTSVEEVLQSIKTIENARLAAKGPTRVQKIMLGKLAGQAASASGQVAAYHCEYHYDTSLAGLHAIKQGVLDFVKSAPRRWALKLPWMVAGIYARAGTFIFDSMLRAGKLVFGSLFPASLATQLASPRASPRAVKCGKRE